MSVCGKMTSALEAPPSVSGAAAHLHLKGQTKKRWVFAHPQRVTILTCYVKISVWYFELKLHIHTLGTSKNYFTYFFLLKRNVWKTNTVIVYSSIVVCLCFFPFVGLYMYFEKKSVCISALKKYWKKYLKSIKKVKVLSKVLTISYLSFHFNMVQSVNSNATSCWTVKFYPFSFIFFLLHKKYLVDLTWNDPMYQ